MGCGNSVEGKGDSGSSPAPPKPAPAPAAAPKPKAEPKANIPDSPEPKVEPPAPDPPKSEPTAAVEQPADAPVVEKSWADDKPEEATAQPEEATPIVPRPDGLPETNEPPNGVGLPGRLVTADDTCAVPEHLYYVFNKWPVLRPGLKEFLSGLVEQREKGTIKGIYIYTANTSIEWVKFVMTCMISYLDLSTDLFGGIKHAPGGLKIVPENCVLYDDHPENVTGNCVAVDPYHNEIPWSILEPVVKCLPDDGKGGLQAYIERDKQYPDIPHEVESEGTLAELAEELGEELKAEEVDEVLLDMDETLIAGARTSAYFFAINHFIKFGPNFPTAEPTEEG